MALESKRVVLINGQHYEVIELLQDSAELICYHPCIILHPISQQKSMVQSTHDWFVYDDLRISQKRSILLFLPPTVVQQINS